MPLIALLRPEQRAWLRRLRRRTANRELMRRTRADIDRKLLCPSVDLPIEINHAFDNAETAITALLETAVLEDGAPEKANASADSQNPVPLLDERSALGDPRLRW